MTARSNSGTEEAYGKESTCKDMAGLSAATLFCAFLCSLSMFLIFLPVAVATPTYYPPEDCIPKFPPRDSSAVVLEQRYYFEGCDFGKTTVMFCPHPLLLKKYLCVQRCVECHDDPWTCTKWETEGCDPSGGFEIIDEPCGKEYVNGNWTLMDWVPLDATGWVCPNARKLAELYTPKDYSISFTELSIGGESSNSILRSKERTSMMFSAYVGACLDRIPILRLTVEFVDEAGEVASREYGLYAKHKTLDYLNENRGLIEGFVVPDGKAFRKTYTISSVLDGYVGWAWRRQFVEAVEKMRNLSGNDPAAWKRLEGDVPKTAGKVGDVYFSTDFVGGFSVEGDQNEECKQTLNVERMCTLNLLKMNTLGGPKICDAGEFSKYYSNHGLDSELEQLVRSGCGISGTVDVTGVSIGGSGGEIEISNNTYTVVVDTEDIFGMNYSSFEEYVSNPSNVRSVYDVLAENGKISENSLKTAIHTYILNNFGEGRCFGSVEDYRVAGVRLGSVEKLGEDSASLKLRIDIAIGEGYLVSLGVSTTYDYNCTQSWTWGSFSNLDPNSLAECLYNWDICLGTPRNSRFREAAAAGYGPMEATPTLENDTERILMDGTLLRETRSMAVTVYKSCGLEDAWVAPPEEGGMVLLYACPIEAYIRRGGYDDELQYIGKKEVSSTYPRDLAEGQQYMVLKCNVAPSLDEADFVEKVGLGSLASLGLDSENRKIYYICTPEGWVPWKKKDSPNSTDPWDIKFFEVVPSRVNVCVGKENEDIWSVKILNKKNRTIEAELTVYSKTYPTAIEWIDFKSGSTYCGENCRKVSISLPPTDIFDPYREVHERVHLDKAERLGKYEFKFELRETVSEKLMYSDTAWLNVFSDSVGGADMYLLFLFYSAMVALVIYKWR
ncbi:MAG: hypothetical protein ACP5E4_03910 [Candidatus Aenigmatarchaeota archaeon]